MFEPNGKCVMVEVVEIEGQEDMADNEKKFDLIVFATGEDATLYEKGDKVQTPPASPMQCATIEDRTFAFWEEGYIFGKYTKESK